MVKLPHQNKKSTNKEVLFCQFSSAELEMVFRVGSVKNIIQSIPSPKLSPVKFHGSLPLNSSTSSSPTYDFLRYLKSLLMINDNL